MKNDKGKQTIYDCAGLGICPADYICLLDHYPDADEKTVARAFSRQGGGPVPTALCALSKWGARTAIISLVGEDYDGDFIRGELHAAGVDTRHLKSLKGKRTARSFIWVDLKTGTRAVVLDRTGMPVMQPKDIVLAELPPARYFHCDGRDTDACLKAARQYRRRGTTIVMDAGSVRGRMEELIAATDHFVASHHFIRQYFGARTGIKTACRRLLGQGPSAVLITLAEKGCICETRDGDSFSIPGHRGRHSIIDTTGCGDVFHGGYIYGLLQGWPIKQCARFANAAAFLKCGRPGGRIGIPRLEDALVLSGK